MAYLRTATFILFLLSFIGTLAHGESSKECKVCGMYIDLYQKTAAQLETVNGEHLYTCGVACMLRIINDNGGPEAFTKISAKDWWNGQEVSGTTATYVLSSAPLFLT